MGKCTEKNRRLWKDMQRVWIEELEKNNEFSDIDTYDFEVNDEWTCVDYEHSPLSQIIWGFIIANYFNSNKEFLHDEDDKYDFIINRNALIVSNKEKRFRFLFDVMNNPKYNIGRTDWYDYHFIGNYAPIPGNVVLKRSLQFIHRDKDEKWDEFLKEMRENWENYKMGFTYEKYIEMTLQDMYFSDKELKEIIKLDSKNIINEKIGERGKAVKKKILHITNPQNIAD